MEPRSDILQENTSHYLENYLNPVRNWDQRIRPAERMYKIVNANVNWREVAYHIQQMDYYHFLKTPYWRAIAAHTKYKAGYRCQLCNSSHRLATHHRNYAIHGFEHANLHELTVLCNDCHNKFHGQKSDGSYYEGRPDWNLIVFVTLTVVIFSFYLWDVTPLQSVGTPKKDISSTIVIPVKQEKDSTFPTSDDKKVDAKMRRYSR